MNERPSHYSSVESCVEETLERVGRRIVLGTPLGLGKANHIVNEFFQRARKDSRIELHIFTALTLSRPRWKNELERRFLEPLSERLFGGYPELDYLDAVKSGELPENIRVNEFYFQPRSLLESPLAQQAYVSSNYTHVVRDVLDAGVNVLAQLVGKEQENGAIHYSLSCNPDLTLDLVPRLRALERKGQKIAVLAQVNRELPFMYGDAAIAPGYFDAVLDDARYEFPLFGVPNRPVSTAEYVIALYVSTLVRDGGTIQIGIGSLGHAITYLLKLRHERNSLYRELLVRAGVLDRFGDVIARVGGIDPFQQGLYASSEMFVDGFLELYRAGILKRRVYDHDGVQRLLNEKRIGEEVTRATLEAFVEAGIISPQLTLQDLTLLQSIGVLKPDVAYEPGSIRLKDGTHISTDLADEQTMDALSRALGTRLKDGHIAHACFLLGPRNFYEALRRLDRAEREQICMTGVSYVNQLYGQEEIKRLQRKEARFLNTGLVVTLNGAVASDTLEDGRVLSGVGGQYNFVAMAQALEDARSVLMIRATAEDDHGKTQSNVRWSYGHVTIPRHLRDIVVSEYGIADVRGRSDENVATALIEIADANFQDELLVQAKGKVAQEYRLPVHASTNRQECLEELLAPYRERGLFEPFPFGTELTNEELVLKKALTFLKRMLKGQDLELPGPEEIRKTILIPKNACPYLERMRLEHPQDAKELLMQRAIVYALASVDAI